MKFKAHVAKWKDGCGSCLCEKAAKIVFIRGKIPCDILFVGEAPGASENLIGRPFCGPAGKLLDDIIEEAVAELSYTTEFRIAFTNLVGCMPTNEDGKIEPPKEAIKQCLPKLVEAIAMCKPRLVVCVGKLSAKQIRLHRPALGLGDTKLIDMTHPAAILRLNDPVSTTMSIDKCVIVLANAMRELE